METTSSYTPALIHKHDVEQWFPDCKYDKKWRWLPDCGSDGIACPIWCNDCQDFHQYWYHTGFSKDEEGLWVELWACDTDGDWEFVDGVNLDLNPDGVEDPSHKVQLESNACWLQYWKFVFRTGRDPLNEILDRSVNFKEFARKQIENVKRSPRDARH